MTDCIIFDFDGTLADTERHSLAIYNKLAEEHGFTVFTLEEVEELKHMIPAKIIAKAKIPYTKLFKVLKEGQEMLKKHINEVPSFEADLKSVLDEVRPYTKKIGVISSNLKKNIRRFLKNNGVDDMDFIISSPLFTKEAKILKVIRKYHFDAARVVYVGDEFRDITASKKAGVKIVSVTWGYNSRELLEKGAPDAVIDNLSELTSLVRRI
jgi:phosphoglycolate phosphatase